MKRLALMLLLAPGAAQAQPPAQSVVGRYQLSGARELRPVEISDDGVRTYLRWHDEQELPAVFALGARGNEETVDGYMRDGIFTIDRINPRLAFRIDQRVAYATRSLKRE